MAVDRGAPNGKPANTLVDALNPGDRLLHGQYRIDSYLNAGGFGITYLAFDSLDRKVVIKECFPNAMCCRSNNVVMARSSSQQDEFRSVVRHFGQEARRISKLKHPNIVGVHQVFEDNGTAYMALDFVEGRDLLDIIEHERDRLSPPEIKRILLKLLDAIAYVHERDLLHRDISPDNILLDGNDNPVLIDFGAARDVATRQSRALSALHMVKDGYSPQEFYLATNLQSPSSDLYSLAATFYHLITGAPPPNSQIRLSALASDDADPHMPIPPRTLGYDHFFLGAIDKALAVFPKDRIQSAVEWIEEIDKERRRKALVERAKKDDQIEMSIRQLTAETNKALEAEVEELNTSSLETAIRGSRVAAARVKSPAFRHSEARRPGSEGGAAGKGRGAVAEDRRLYALRETDRDLVIADPDARPRRRSLFSRIISVPIWIFSGRDSDEPQQVRRVSK